LAAQAKILVVDDMPQNIRILRDRLIAYGYQVIEAANGEEAIHKIQEANPDAVLLDILMPKMDGYQVLERLKSDIKLRHMPVIMISAVDQLESVAKCLELGAEDYLCKPFNAVILKARLGACLQKLKWREQEKLYLKQIEETNTQLVAEIRERERAEKELKVLNDELEKRVADRTSELKQALDEVERLKNRLQAENVYLQSEIKLAHNFEEIIGQSRSIKGVLEQVEQVAATDATVLILGESGTGKELLARAIHSISPRNSHPLVKVDCAALPANLIESELFGHEKGAFTGALMRRIGRFELADEGTAFLDEVGELPIELQVKLLRVLQEGEFERLGSATTTKVDVRVIAATNRNLAKAVATGVFREDLFYRLNVFPIRCPPLRERKEDIPLFVKHFIEKYSAKIGKNIEAVPGNAMDELLQYDWPGNVRELENVVERAVILSKGKQLDLEDWLPKTDASSGGSLILTLEEKEREHILYVLELTGWKVRGAKGAAELLGMKPTTLEARMKKLDIERQKTAFENP
jgi:chemotaxis protein methyltransferase CheR